MEKNISLIKKYYLYSKERFPIPVTLPYAVAIYYLSYFFVNILKNSSDINLAHSIIGSLVIFFSLFHLRIFDEHKDYDSDKIAHPDRMLSTGEITLKELRILLYILLVLECGLSLYLGFTPFVIWLIIFLYSFLMFKEFFVPEFLNKNLGLYLITHQISVPLALLLGISQRIDFTTLKGFDLILFFLFLFGAMMLTINFEISRKTWSSDREHEHADSYTKVWGNTKTVIINQLVAISALVIFIYFYNLTKAHISYTLITVFLFTIFFISEIVFLRKPENKLSKIVESTGALYTLGMIINTAIFFYNL